VRGTFLEDDLSQQARALLLRLFLLMACLSCLLGSCLFVFHPAAYDQELSRRELTMPVEGMDPKSVHDSFNEARGRARSHRAADILAPRGTAVVAIDDGPVKKLLNNREGGLSVYQFDRGEVYCYYYAHLDRYARGLKEGSFLRRGERLGFVGTTGNAPPHAPHLHFAIFKLGRERRWWEGTPVNPYPVLMAIGDREPS